MKLTLREVLESDLPTLYEHQSDPGLPRYRCDQNWIGPAHWGRGIASEALRRFLDDEDRSRPLFAFVAKPNVASRRVAEKCGFVDEMRRDATR